MPCSDAKAYACERQNRATTDAAVTDHKGNQDTGHEDLCSPFCQCACCSVACAVPLVSCAPAELSPFVPTKVYAIYLRQHPEGVLSPVWQPPQCV